MAAASNVEDLYRIHLTDLESTNVPRNRQPNCGESLSKVTKELYNFSTEEDKSKILKRIDIDFDGVFGDSGSDLVKMWLIHIIMDIFPESDPRLKKWCIRGSTLLSKSRVAYIKESLFCRLMRDKINKILSPKRTREDESSSSSSSSKAPRNDVAPTSELADDFVFTEYVPSPSTPTTPPPVSIPPPPSAPTLAPTIPSRDNFTFNEQNCRMYSFDGLKFIYDNFDGLIPRVPSTEEYKFLLDKFKLALGHHEFLFRLWSDFNSEYGVVNMEEIMDIVRNTPLCHRANTIQKFLDRDIRSSHMMLVWVESILFGDYEYKSIEQMHEKIDQARPIFAQIQKDQLRPTTQILYNYLDNFIQGFYESILKKIHEDEHLLCSSFTTVFCVYFYSFIYLSFCGSKSLTKHAKHVLNLAVLSNQRCLTPKDLKCKAFVVALNMLADKIADYDVCSHYINFLGRLCRLKSSERVAHIEFLVNLKYNNCLAILIDAAAKPELPIWTEFSQYEFVMSLVEALEKSNTLEHLKHAHKMLSFVKVAEKDYSKFIAISQAIGRKLPI